MKNKILDTEIVVKIHYAIESFLYSVVNTHNKIYYTNRKM